MEKKKVLFVCIHNSARSQMAEAWMNHLCGDRFEAESAGLEPGTLNPLAVAVMKEVGIDISGKATRSVFYVLKAGTPFSYVITVCDESAAEACPIFPGPAKHVHLGFTDPSRVEGTQEEKLVLIRAIRDSIRKAIEDFCRQEQPSGTQDKKRSEGSAFMASDIAQIAIGDRTIGIVGLKKVMADLAMTASGKTDEECREILYQGIADQNYIPPKMATEYKDALLRAFKIYTGEAAEEAPAGGVRIQVLGPGCYNCDRMEQDVREVLAELKMPGDLSHVTDPAEIAKYGLMGVPALVINGRIVCVGTVPDRNRIKQWLMDVKASGKCKEGN